MSIIEFILWYLSIGFITAIVWLIVAILLEPIENWAKWYVITYKFLLVILFWLWLIPFMVYELRR